MYDIARNEVLGLSKSMTYPLPHAHKLTPLVLAAARANINVDEGLEFSNNSGGHSYIAAPKEHRRRRT